jgi:hypothetical protein
MARRQRDKSAMKLKECLAVALNCAGAFVFLTPQKTQKSSHARNIRPERPLSPFLDVLALPFVGVTKARLRNSNPQE